MLFIYIPAITNRIKYVMDYVFNEQLGIAYTLCDDENMFRESNATQKIIYAEQDIISGIYFYNSGLLLQAAIKDIELNADKVNETPVIFKHDKKDALGFDVFAAIFYLLSRYEEYMNKPTDKFENYNYRNSVLYNLNALHIPVIELWIKMLKNVLMLQFPSLQFKISKAMFALSFDIDVAYAYQNRSFKRVMGGIVKKIFKLQFAALIDQMLTLFYIRKDMYDTYNYIFSRIKNNKAFFFFNMGEYSEYDKNPSHKNKVFRKLIKGISLKHHTGLHPSYASNCNSTYISKEKNRLEEIAGETVTLNRQHYLKLKLPYTYQQLIRNGMQKDFTIGYHDAYGFRAGTCKPFLFFDLEANEITNLRLYPFSIMEGTLNDVMHINISEAKKIINELLNVVVENEGLFIPLWHNSTLSNAGHWKNWREVFEFMLNEIEKKNIVNFADTI